MAIQKYLSVSELAAMSLPGLPGAKKNIAAKAERENWESRPRSGRGGGVEYAVSSLPAAARAELESRAAVALLSSAAAATPARREEQLELTLPTVDQLNDDRRAVAEARCAIVAQVNTLALALGVDRAITQIVEQARAGSLPEHVQQFVRRANARKGEARTLSKSTVYRWYREFRATNDSAQRMCRLATKTWGAAAAEEYPWWTASFLREYCQPNKPSVSAAYAAFARGWPANESEAPSVHVVRRLLKRLPPVVTYRGRNTGAALKAKLPYVRRDWSCLAPNDVWIGDGHGMKCKVIRPDTGKPGVVELTMIIDGFSRLVVGWSVSLSENVIAVSDALRHAMTQHPPCLIYYSDNGAGQTGKHIDDNVHGVLARVGIHHETGIAGNPQGRGIIERAWQTIAIPLAKKYPTFRGSSHDRDTLRIVGRDIDKAMRADARGEAVSMPHAPTLTQFVDDLTAAIAGYNTCHQHSELPRAHGRYMTPAEAYASKTSENQQRLHPLELRDLTVPSFTRRAKRGWVELFGSWYFDEALMSVDGQDVRLAVAWDDSSRVNVYRADGRFVCVALHNGNTHDAFPATLVEKKLTERVARQKKLKTDQLADIERQLNPIRTIEQSPDISQFVARPAVAQPADEIPVFLLPSEREEWLAQQAARRAVG